MTADIEVLEKTVAYDGYFRIDRYRLRHRTHAGEWSREMVREVFERGHAAAILLYDPQADQVGLIEQFRPGAMAAGWPAWQIETVAGIIDEGETPERTALRETREEAGIEAAEMVPICRYLVSPGGASETVHLFCARCDAQQLSGLHGLAEEAEDIRLFALPLAQALEWIASGRICNAMTIIALQWLATHRDEIKARWRT